ncbi:MAG: hypothetical protein RJB39_616 [Candidatus Parcubacteria bacterium]|jgi:hypothetical protein
MGILRKLIGLFFLVIIFFIILKSKSILPRMSNWVIGPEQTPFQIGTSYIDEIYKAPGYGGEGDAMYAAKTASLVQGWPRSMRAVTVSKTGSKITISVEGVAVPTGLPLAFWLSDTPDITNKTKYINFGKIVGPYTFREYAANVGKVQVDLKTYKYLMVVNTETYVLYSLWTLNQ